ncbi:peptide cleavage/export ABC transporter [Streptococcus dentapri]|uniref:Peptide cleavage/export ABC transporter n=1 Tax=Streptococcus dentapri TaxID=573564 RepID=A0ABV8D3E1_9STRE
MRNYPYIPQVDERDCGVAALAMILKNYGSSYSLAHLRELAQTSREGTSALGLVRAAQSLGLRTRAIRADMGLFDDDHLSYPFIVHVVKDKSLQHYYTVFGQKDGRIIIGDPDPSQKLIKLTRDAFEKEWTGVALFFEPSETYEIHQEKMKGLLSFVPHLLKKKGLIALIIALSFMVTVINIVGSYYLQAMLDTLIPRALYSILSLVSLGLCFAYLGQQVLYFFQTYLLNRLSNYLSAQVILPYIKHVLSLPMTFFTSRRTGEITSRFGDASTIIDALASTILTLFLDLTIVITLAVTLFVQSPKLFSLTLVAVPLYGLVILTFLKLFEQQNYQVMESNSQVNTVIIDDLRGIETLKSLRVEERRYATIEGKFDDYLNKSLKRSKWEAIQTSLKMIVQLVFNILILWYGAHLVMQGELSVGQLITYNMLLNYFTTPLTNIINLQEKLQQAKVANNRLQEVYVVDKEEKDQQDQTHFQALRLTGVSHRFSYQQETLRGIDLSVKRGEKIALMGKSGSGKTTLAKILAGYYKVNDGQVYIDDQAVSYPQLRQLVTYVPQQSYIFTGTILDNLLLGTEAQADEQELIKACETAEILDDIKAMPLGFETQISEDGGLSGGQKQRLAIARALLTKQPILVFDEATSGLDSDTEGKVIENLAQLDRTMVFVAHRGSISYHASRIVKIDAGQKVSDKPNYRAHLVRLGLMGLH